MQALDERCLDPIHQPALVRDVHLHLRSDTRDNNPLIALAGPLEGLASAHCLLGAAERPLDMNPTSPLGVGGLGRFLFHPSLFPFGEGFTPPPLPPPLDLDGGFRDPLERPRWPKMAPRGPQRAQDNLQDRSR